SPIIEATFAMYAFVCEFCRIHRDLLSFPTRRSSDLVDEERGPTLLCADATWSLEALRRQVEPHPLTFAVMGGRREFRRSFLQLTDRKSTRLNSSHVKISYAVFCLKKKNTPTRNGQNG